MVCCNRRGVSTPSRVTFSRVFATMSQVFVRVISSNVSCICASVFFRFYSFSNFTFIFMIFPSFSLWIGSNKDFGPWTRTILSHVAELCKDILFYLVHWLSITLKLRRISQDPSFWKESFIGLFFGYVLYAGRICKCDVLIADFEELETMDASEI